MMQSITFNDDTKLTQINILNLCKKITGLSSEALNKSFRNALIVLGSQTGTLPSSDEFELTERIKRKLARFKGIKDAAIFSELHRKLQAQDTLKERWSILYMLYKLSLLNQQKNFSNVSCIISSRVSSTPLNSLSDSIYVPSLQNKQHVFYPALANKIDHLVTPVPVAQSTFIQSKASNTLVKNIIQKSEGHSQNANPEFLKPSAIHFRSHNNELSENVILRDVIYCFQGIEGQYIKYDKIRESFFIDKEVNIKVSMRKLAILLCECGFLYNKVSKFVEMKKSDRSSGLVCQSLCGALQQQLMEYYRLIAILEAQLQQEEDLGISSTQPFNNCLTLRRLRVWAMQPTFRLKNLVSLLDSCQILKGGALASSVYSYLYHGDPGIKSLINLLLTSVVEPIYRTVVRWIYDGELDDAYQEFFIASDSTVKDDKLWYDKYSIRKTMLPSFINNQQANKILLTGKTINFLRQVCGDRTLMNDRDVVKSAETKTVDSIFMQDHDNSFSMMIDSVYKETSKFLLQVLHEKYKLMDHLKAMRRYLLLGQGDFIRHLMDLLEEDLAKPAQSLYLHNLSGILESAIRATNAQFEDAEIIKRLDVRLLELSPGDTGWDVFTLDYHVAGPIKTVFTPDTMVTYLRIFNFLWRAKRMEYILALIWKDQIAYVKQFKTFKEFADILHYSRLIGAEMLHFVEQVQYYINFEVLECSWDELLSRVGEAKDLDEVITAHQHFLNTVTRRSLLDPSFSIILTQLRKIFDLVINFQELQSTIFLSINKEIDTRQRYKNKITSNSLKGLWGTDELTEDVEMRRRQQFISSFVGSSKSKLKILHQTYQKLLEEFLTMVQLHDDDSLRCLRFRVNFSEFYKLSNRSCKHLSSNTLSIIKKRRPSVKDNKLETK